MQKNFENEIIDNLRGGKVEHILIRKTFLCMLTVKVIHSCGNVNFDHSKTTDD